MRVYRRSCAPVHVTVTEPEPQTLRLTLDGELDATAGALLRDVAAAVVWAAPTSVEIDAAGLEFVDVRGLRALGDMGERLERWVAVSLTRTSRALDRLVAACAEAGLSSPAGWLALRPVPAGGVVSARPRCRHRG